MDELYCSLIYGFILPFEDYYKLKSFIEKHFETKLEDNDEIIEYINDLEDDAKYSHYFHNRSLAEPIGSLIIGINLTEWMNYKDFVLNYQRLNKKPTNDQIDYFENIVKDIFNDNMRAFRRDIFMNSNNVD